MRTLSLHPESMPTKKMLAIAMLLLVAAGMLQDYTQAILQQQGFYWSESLLFKACWLPFLLTLPILYTKQWRTWYGVPVLTIFHVLSYALIIYVISANTLDHTFEFWDVLKRAVSEDAYKYLLFYGAAILVLRERKAPPQYIARLSFQSGKNNVSVSIAEINYLAADDPYVAVHTTAGTHLSSLALKTLEAQLDPALFIRIHRSTIVAIEAVADYRSRLNGDYDLTLKDGTSLRLSRSYSKEFRQRLSR
ncbi:LytTR family DNA-binding domain-containing protein [Mucilaginibacter calamicampi]|uniref:LytTR family DNA-binding domain-containing protein n=1 Tax=Mucilaginibacter calamicampi TaxID=1302352 RepID=A0ABW2YVC3_9SPHI